MSRKRVVPDVICSCCGKQYHPHYMKQALASEHYCSQQCQLEGQRRKPDAICPICGKAFVRNDDRKTYCSRSCADRSKRKYANKYEARRAWKDKERAKLKTTRDTAKKEREKRKLILEIAHILESYIEEKGREHPCAVCGQLTNRKKYCSQRCANNAQNNRHGQKRRAKIRNALVDSDISLPELFSRDNGACWICGAECDWNDKEERNGTIVCGGQYPSIDHVIPLSKGGLHSWSNVRLACRCCNSLKGDTYPPAS